MMTQTGLHFQYQGSDQDNFTALAGLPLFLEMAEACGLGQAAEKLRLKSQGWTDSSIIMSLLLLNIAGGDCVEDINRLEADKGIKGPRRKQRGIGLPPASRIELIAHPGVIAYSP